MRIEGQRLGSERPPVGRKLYVEAIFAHQPGAFPGSWLRVVPPLVYQGVQDRDVRLPIAEFYVIHGHFLNVPLRLAHLHSRSGDCCVRRTVQD